MRRGGRDLTVSAKLVGARGKVVGIDPDEHLLAEARKKAGRQRYDVEFRLGETIEMTDFAAYDLVYTRYLLSKRSNHEAAAALHWMISAVRPGGMIVVEDLECQSDGDGHSVDNPAYSRFLELFNALLRDEEVNGRGGILNSLGFLRMPECPGYIATSFPPRSQRRNRGGTPP